MIWRWQTSFTGGEISERLFGRVDLPQYKNSLARLENFILHPHGGATTRPGTFYGWPVKDATKVQRLLPFEYSADISYVLEIGPEYIRLGRDGSLLTVGTLDAWDSGTTYAHGALVSYSGVNYYSLSDANLNYNPSTETDWWYPLSGDVFEIPTPYQEDELFDLHITQSADVMWFFHPDYPTKRLERYGEAEWLFVNEVFLDGPYLPLNSTTTTLVASAGTGSVTVTASAADGINDGQGFLSTDVGRLVRIYNSAAWKWGEITDVADSTNCTVTVVVGSFPTSATTQWKLGKYSDTTGYPAVGALHEARLVVANDSDIDLSETDALSSFRVQAEVTDSDACSFKTLSNEVNQIKWLTTARGGLAVGTTGGEWLMNGGGQDEPITPSAILARRHTTVGGANIQALQVGNAVLFVARDGKALHEFAYLYDDDSYRSPDLTLLAEHLLRSNTIVDIDIQRSSSIVWCVRSDGTLMALTYKRDDKVVGWHRHTTGGSVKSVTCVNGGDRDIPYFIVERTIDGSTVKYVEYMADEFNSDDLADAYLVDCGVLYDGVATTTITGLDHLEGEDVDVLADGIIVSNKTVSSGQIGLDYAASKVAVGLHYVSDLETLPIEEPLNDGASIGRVKSLPYVAVRLSDSYGLKAGPGSDNLDEIIFNENITFGEAPEPFSGEKSIFIEGAYSSDKRVYLRRDMPLPVTINALVVNYEVWQR
jgi:hypothetical protein